MPSRSTIEVLKNDKTQNGLAAALVVVILLSVDIIKCVRSPEGRRYCNSE